MADAVTTQTYDGKTDGKDYIRVHLTNLSDGTGESLVTKLDRSLYRGDAIKKLNLKSIRWSIQGFTYVRLDWDHTADDAIMMLGSGSGYEFYDNVLVDPNTSADAVTGAIGDILLTTGGAILGATYDITAIFVAVE